MNIIQRIIHVLGELDRDDYAWPSAVVDGKHSLKTWSLQLVMYLLRARMYILKVEISAHHSV